ncbi:MAG: hypothetical protein ACJAS1_000498 [Oleiphilaceae bacterium]|jgi:hypothetical protein
MILQSIDKVTYRKNLNKVITCVIAALFIIALGVSSLLIHFIGEQDSSNFTLNLVGVCFAASIVGVVLYRIRVLPFMSEVLYVWCLKQELNAIYRRSAKLNPALELNNYNALIVRYYYLKGSIQLYELDDNDLTLDSLREELLEFDEKIQVLDVVVSTDDYRRDLLKQLSETAN